MKDEQRAFELLADYRAAAVRHCVLAGATTVQAAHEILDDLCRRKPNHFAAMWWAFGDSSYQTKRFEQEFIAALPPTNRRVIR